MLFIGIDPPMNLTWGVPKSFLFNLNFLRDMLLSGSPELRCNGGLTPISDREQPTLLYEILFLGCF